MRKDRSLDSCFEEIQCYSHYQGADYTGIRNRYGDKFLRKRLNGQLDLYRIHHSEDKDHPLHWKQRAFRSFLKMGLICTGLYPRAKQNARTPVVIERTILLPQLPAEFDGIRILQVSDFHFEFIPELPKIMKQALSGTTFDLCVCTGDFRGETTGPYQESLEHLATCRESLGPDMYTVLGNHDNVELIPRLSALGIRCLVNESVYVRKGESSLCLVGIDDPHYYQTHDLENFRQEVKDAATSILLSHSPEICREAAEIGFDVMLSGHTHGGQICLPGGFPVMGHIGSAPRKCLRGAWNVDQLQGYTSNGIGCSTMDVRLNCPPELTIHTLKRI